MVTETHTVATQTVQRFSPHKPSIALGRISETLSVFKCRPDVAVSFWGLRHAGAGTENGTATPKLSEV